MKYVIDHDLHIHSQLSTCSNNPEQNPKNILAYAERNNFKTICLTDHLWDATVEGTPKWYLPQDIEHISEAKPLPQSEKVRFLFGCETELDSNFRLGLAPEHYDLFDFIIIPTTHMHFKSVVPVEHFESIEMRAKLWVDRLEAVLNMDLPFQKVGIAHLACEYLGFPSWENYLTAMQMIPDAEMERLFAKAAKLGVGIEINAGDMKGALVEPDIVLRLFCIAKKCGCKFYLGSDAHHPQDFNYSVELFEKAIDMLQLEEADKFIIGK